MARERSGGQRVSYQWSVANTRDGGVACAARACGQLKREHNTAALSANRSILHIRDSTHRRFYT
eukprot:6172132-Pyramimonas_sp.AAC.1